MKTAEDVKEMQELEYGESFSMSVKDLIETLQSLPEDALVVQSEDPEGNGYYKTTEIAVGIFYRGEFTDYEEEYDLIASEEQRIKAVCLFPGH